MITLHNNDDHDQETRLSSSVPRGPLTWSARIRLSEIVAPLVLSSVFVSFVLFVFAANAYPGGTHFDHFAVGHDFWRNTLCDVARSTALGGASNAIGASLARTAMTIMAIGVGGLFLLLPDRFASSPRLGLAVRVLGCIAVPAAIAVVFLSTDRFGVLHGIAIVVAGIPGLAAAVLAVIGLLREPARTRPRWITRIGVVALLIAAADFVLYVQELLTHGSASVAVSVLERLAALLVLAWMIGVARGGYRVDHYDGERRRARLPQDDRRSDG
jgi:hypothetical protein